MSKLKDTYKKLSEGEALEEGAESEDGIEVVAEGKDKESCDKDTTIDEMKDDVKDKKGSEKVETKEGDEEDEDNDNGKKKEVEESFSIDASLTSLFEGTDFDADAQAQMKTLIEAAIIDKTDAVRQELQESFDKKLEEANEQFDENADKYLSFMSEKWIEENQVAVSNQLKLEALEDFVEGMRVLFTENYIDVPDTKKDLVEDLVAKNDALEAKLNEALEENIRLVTEAKQSEEEKVLADICEGLTLVQKSKMQTFAEGIEYESVEQYESKLNIIKDKYFAESSQSEDDLNESAELNTEDELVENKTLSHRKGYAAAARDIG